MNLTVKREFSFLNSLKDDSVVDSKEWWNAS